MGEPITFFLDSCPSMILFFDVLLHDEPALNKCTYFAVIDKLQRAKQVDPSVAEEANKLIGRYSGPVSYTHLDVYKRQIFNRAAQRLR